MATLYCRVNSSSVNWGTLSRWFQDAAGTIPATALPLSTDDVVIIFTNTSSAWTFLGGVGTRTVKSMTINGPTVGSSEGRVEGTFVINGNVILNNNTTVWFSTVTSTDTVTLNNNSRLAGTINITASNGIICNDYSRITPTSGIGTFNIPSITLNDYSLRAANMTTTATFNDYSVNAFTLNGNATFNDNSGQQPSGSVRGIINGNATITSSTLYYKVDTNFPPSPNPYGTAYGVYTFPVYRVDSGTQSVTGTITFSSVTPVSIIVSSSLPNGPEYPLGWNMNSSSWIFSGGTPSWTFTNGTYLASGSNLAGNCTFTENSFYSSGTITGNIIFEDTSYNNGALIVASGKTATFTESSFNNKTISGTVVYNGLTGENAYGYFVKGEKASYLKIPVVVTTLATFNNKSVCGLVLDANALSLLQSNGYTNITYVAVPTITGNTSFKNSSANLGLITGNSTFINRSENRSGISGTATITPDRGVNGSSILGVI